MCSGALVAWRARMRSLHTYPTLATALATFAQAARSAIAQQVPARCSIFSFCACQERTMHTAACKCHVNFSVARIESNAALSCC